MSEYILPNSSQNNANVLMNTTIKIYLDTLFFILLLPWINNNTDAGLHVVIQLVGEHMYTLTLCVCVCVPIQESSSLVDSYVGRTY